MLDLLGMLQAGDYAAHMDFETGSAVELKTAGVHRQMEHPSSRVWGLRWCIVKRGVIPFMNEVQQWRPGWADPEVLLWWIANGGMVVAHNAVFERTVWNNVLRGRKYKLTHWPKLKISQQDCTMARCAVLAIPSSLGVAGKVLGATELKDDDGYKTMMRMARPRTRTVCAACSGTGKTLRQDGLHDTCLFCEGAGETYTWWDDDEHLNRNMLYCGQDVISECDIDARAPFLSERSRFMWMHDQVVNDRGFKIDMPLVERAIHLREFAKDELNKAIKDVTGGAVTKFSQTKRLVDWINSLGVACESVAKDKQEAVLADAEDELGTDIQFMLSEEKLPTVIHRAIALRKLANKTSTAKYTAMQRCVCADGRARGQFHWHGASSGRYAGRLIQPHNLYRTDPERDGDDIRKTIDVIMAGIDDVKTMHTVMEILVGPPMEYLPKITRSMIIPEKGRKLVGADLSNIEGRGSAWISGEEWKLEAFRAYDRKEGPDLYCVAYAKAFGDDAVAIQKNKEKGKRQLGKVQELALGYQGNVGAFLNMAKVYGLVIANLVAPVHAAAGADAWLQQSLLYAGARDKRGLTQDEWTAVKIIINGWRAAHPLLTAAWYELQDAAIEAVENPGLVVPVLNGKGAYFYQGGFLWAQLPSKRVISYCRPRLVRRPEAWIEYGDGRSRFYIDDYDAEEVARWTTVASLQHGELKVRWRNRVDYEGYDGEKKAWGVFSLYGGMQFNHFVQGMSMDVLFGGMERHEAAGYPIVFHCHDEAVGEPDAGHGSADHFAALLAQGEDWLPGCPLAAEGWEGDRYGK